MEHQKGVPFFAFAYAESKQYLIESKVYVGIVEEVMNDGSIFIIFCIVKVLVVCKHNCAFFVNTILKFPFKNYRI